jgi:hypothetical protein
VPTTTLWHERPEPGCLILKVGVVLTRLCEQGGYTPQLAEPEVLQDDALFIACYRNL